MEVHFTPEQQAQLAQIATTAGSIPERLVSNVVARYLDDETRFLAAVEKGIAAAEAVSLSKKKRWTPAFMPCASPDAHSLDRSSDRKPKRLGTCWDWYSADSNRCEAVFNLNCPAGPAQVRENYGFSRREIRQILAVLVGRLVELCRTWEQIHGIA